MNLVNNIKKQIRFKNDLLRQQIHMNYNQFCEAVDRELPEGLMYKQKSGELIPAKPLIKEEYRNRNLNNYYQEFLNLLYN